MTWYKKDGKWLKEDGKWAISENCCCGDYWCVRDLHNYHVYSSIFEGDKFYVSKRPDGGDAVYTQASQNEEGEWLFCTESIEINDGNGVYVFLEEPEEGEELDENDIYTIYPQGDSEGYRCIGDCECVHLDGNKCCNECDGRALNMRCIRSWEFDENTMEFIAAHTDEQKCYDNCGKWFCFGDEQCCEDDDDDCDEDTIDYECRFGASDEGNKLSGPYLEESDCTENCKEPPECPTCVIEACKYIFDPPPECEDPSTDPPDCEDIRGEGGGWAKCCDDLRERWRYETDEWVLLHPCSEDFNAPPGAGTPACKVTTREFPDNPEDNAIVDFPCEIDWEFEPPDDNEACGVPGGCGFTCIEDEDDPDESTCERDPAGNRKTLEECENKCPEKWLCTAVNECELNGDGEYDTEEECKSRSVQKCGAYGACCFEGECEDGYLEQECIDEGGVYYGTSWCDEDPCGVPKWGTCCSFPYTNSGPQPAGTEEEAKKLAAQSASANSAALPNSTWTIGYFKDGEWFEDAALFDAANNQWICTGYWTLGNPATCADVDNEDACKGPFKVFTQGNACGIDECPDAPPPGPIGCCYTASLDNAGDLIYLQSFATDKECFEFQLLSDPNLEYKWNEHDDSGDPCPPEPPLGPGACCFREDGKGTCSQLYQNGGGGSCEGEWNTMEKCCELAEAQAPGVGEGYYYYVYKYQDDDTWYYENFEVMTQEEPEFTDERTEENCKPPVFTCDWENHDPPDVAYQGGSAITCEDYNASIAESGLVVWTPDLPATHCEDVEEGSTCTYSTAAFYPAKSCEEETCDEMAGFSFAEPP